MTIKLRFFDPARDKIENALKPYTKRVTALWTNTEWFKRLAKKASSMKLFRCNISHASRQASQARGVSSNSVSC